MHVTDRDLAPLLIHSRQWNYEVQFVPTVNEALATAVDHLSDVLVVCDENVASLYAAELGALFGAYPSYVIAATEETKSLAGVTGLVDWLIARRAVRSTTVVAIGGGCIQDLVSFTAHLYYRGIAWIFVPTTMLSQADSCIGAKSGINVLPSKSAWCSALTAPRHHLVGLLGDAPRIGGCVGLRRDRQDVCDLASALPPPARSGVRCRWHSQITERSS